MATNSRTVTLGSLGKWFREEMRNAGAQVELKEAFGEMGEVIAEDTQRAFALQQDPSTEEKWAPPKAVPMRNPRTGKRRPQPIRLLILTGDLITAVLNAVKHPNITATTMTIRIWQPFYAIYHQFGTRTIPARPFIGLSKRLEELAIEIVTDAKVRQIEGHT